MAEEIVRARVRAHGRVQGVWFRQSTADAARGLGATGWVRNLPDGSVEAAFEGTRAVVEQALAFVESGPPRAIVEQTDVTWELPKGDIGFEVRG